MRSRLLVVLPAVLLTGCAVGTSGSTESAGSAGSAPPSSAPSASTVTQSPSSDPSASAPTGQVDQAALDAAAQQAVTDGSVCPDDTPAETPVQVEALLPGDPTVAWVLCYALAGGHVQYEVVRWDGSSLRPLPSQQWRDGRVEQVQDSELAGYPQVVDGHLRNLHVGRGTGDCGDLSEWEFEDGRLVLVSVREQECVDGGSTVDPEDWPQVYP